MCGIAGFWHFFSKEFDIASIDIMIDAISHRGPDDRGSWIDREAGVAMANRRLAILDLSPAGRQPMQSQCGRYIMVYNGEVYNYRDLGKELHCSFRGNSDTEVILQACAQWGLDETLQKLNGMFALALWDRQEQKLSVARDRLGIKPLYYGICNGIFYFGSELKSLCAHPDFPREVNRDSLTLLLRHNYIPHPYSIYQNIYKLSPGHKIEINARQKSIELAAYWTMEQVVAAGRKAPVQEQEQNLAELENLLKDAVAARMISDVPLGAFLSGGIDSSLVVVLMQSQSTRPVKTFTIGFEQEQYDEAPYARAVASHLNTEHTELYVSPLQALDIIPQLGQVYDEPFADSSQIPTLLLSQLTRRSVTVALSGDGGDELFAGYERYHLGAEIWRYLSVLPYSMRKLFTAAIRSLPPANWDQLFAVASHFLPRRYRVMRPGEKMYRLLALTKTKSEREMYKNLVSHWLNPNAVIINGKEPSTALDQDDFSDEHFIRRMMYWDSVMYLPEDLLTKVDRASMAYGLEARVPLLDHRVVESAWRMPPAQKYQNKEAKWPLRQILEKYVPRELFTRPKMGFGVPIGQWLRGPLKIWAEELLDEKRLEQEGYFIPAPIRRKWQEHLCGKQNNAYHLWGVLMFQAWQEKWISKT